MLPHDEGSLLCHGVLADLSQLLLLLRPGPSVLSLINKVETSVSPIPGVSVTAQLSRSGA